jgi:hypothetical protein
LNLLAEYPNGELLQQEFYHALRTRKDSYYNAFLRVKNRLLDGKLIGYRLDEHTNKMIGLTPKGWIFLQKIRDLEDLITESGNTSNLNE